MGALEGKGFGDPKRLAKKSKKSGVELEPNLQTTVQRDAAAFDAMCAAGKRLKPPVVKGNWR